VRTRIVSAERRDTDFPRSEEPEVAEATGRPYHDIVEVRRVLVQHAPDLLQDSRSNREAGTRARPRALPRLMALNALDYLFKLGHASNKRIPFAMLNLQVPYGRQITFYRLVTKTRTC